jgi:hypothetical protein
MAEAKRHYTTRSLLLVDLTLFLAAGEARLDGGLLLSLGPALYRRPLSAKVPNDVGIRRDVSRECLTRRPESMFRTVVRIFCVWVQRCWIFALYRGTDKRAPIAF